ncbi:MAG: hypothetical protein MUO38_09820 [Anaerolineales bacterium]|nr:hypothetical protein [Anaerolineales bacterium]
MGPIVTPSRRNRDRVAGLLSNHLSLRKEIVLARSSARSQIAYPVHRLWFDETAQQA